MLKSVCQYSTYSSARAGICSLNPKVNEEVKAGMDELMQCRKYVWKQLVGPSVLDEVFKL